MVDIAVLFARQDSIYKTFPGVDVWDIDRDARRFPGGCPVVAHPPCRAWGRLRAFAKPRPDEKDLARWAIGQIRQWGGVLEHPESSSLWADQNLPRPGIEPDRYGGWTLPIHQFWWGHRAQKKTWLYIVGCSPLDIPDIPLKLGTADCKIRLDKRRADGSHIKKGDPDFMPLLGEAEREHTPEKMAQWLVELARRCRTKSQAAA